MRNAVIGATGRTGREITKELAQRGHQVTAISRHPKNTLSIQNVSTITGDASDEAGMAHVVTGHDAAVSAVNFKDSEPTKLISAVRLVKVPRYLAVGGAGSHEVSTGLLLSNSPHFPGPAKEEAGRGILFLESLRQTTDIDWTFLSPSANFFEGPRTGKFRLGEDHLLSNENGSAISFADYAIAVADEIETPRHSHRRFTVGY